MNSKKIQNNVKDTKVIKPALPLTPDENMQVMIYGNITIRDVTSGEILLNKRFK